MKGVAVHWTVTPARQNHAQCEQDWANVIAQHEAQGYRPSPAYNWGVCQHGVRMVGRTWAIRSAANGTTQANLDYWAVVALNAPGDTPSDPLLTTLAHLIDEAPDTPVRLVRPHSDFYATACCGDELRGWVASGAQAPYTPGPPGPGSFSQEEPMIILRNSDIPAGPNSDHLVRVGVSGYPLSIPTSDDLHAQGVPRIPLPGLVILQWAATVPIPISV
jgi:hypothetical protein